VKEEEVIINEVSSDNNSSEAAKDVNIHPINEVIEIEEKSLTSSETDEKNNQL